MKKKLILPALAVLAVTALFSCEKKVEPVWEAVVTAKTRPDSGFVFQLDETTLLFPTNLKANPFGHQTRAYIRYFDRGKAVEDTSGRAGEVFYWSEILTKNLEPSTAWNDSLYGHEPLELYSQWTFIEDGYFTVQFMGLWSYAGIPHKIHLLKNTDPSNPLVLELRHDYNGDPVSPGVFGSGLMAFDIRELLTGDKETYDFILKYRAFDKEKSFTFRYSPGKSAGRASISETPETSKFNASVE